MHVCMLWRAAVPVLASGIVGRIVFICTCQYSSAFLASGFTISFTKFLSAAVREYPYRCALLSILLVPRPSRSIAKLFCATHHLTSRESQGKFRCSCAYHGFQPLLPFIVRGFFPVLPHHPQHLTRPQIRLLLCTFSHFITAVNAFPLWSARFSNHRGHPVTDAWSRYLRGLSCPIPAPPVSTVVKLSPVPVWSVRMFRPAVEFFFRPQGSSVILGVVVGRHFPLEGDSVSFRSSFSAIHIKDVVTFV